MNKKKVQIIILILLMAWYGLFFMYKIDLTVVDLGRHIINGQMILAGQFGILDTNFYSYTEPDFPVINHHWGGGVIFYLIWKVFGFAGLSILYLILSLIIFYLFFRLAQKESNFKVALIFSLLLIPLMTARREIRPEIFSYFLMALFFWILWHWHKGKISDKWLWLLPILEIFWVNTHIYFIFGPALIGLFLVDWVIKNKKVRPLLRSNLFINLILTSLATLVSPFGLKGLLYPFNIFKEYGYRIVENQSVWFLENWGFKSPNLRLFEICLILLITSFIVLLIRNRKKFSFIYFVLALVWGGLGWLAIRNFTMFGFFVLLIISFNIKKFGFKFKKISLSVIIFVSLAIFLISFFVYYPKLPLDQDRFGFGLMPGNNGSAQFFKDQNLQGPIFNNYDIGGYLIYYFYPQEKVFTDNRPEAYSISHFQDIYIPAQTNNLVWQELNKEYNFNMIFFSHRDYTNWGQQFLIERVQDPDWAVVYFDSYAIIFLKNIEINRPIIEQYQIPKEYFGF
ncbi:hypothetical protein KKH07_01760 [Patescibacteria group bacterium]|nr:hypothetical protein [Patescibacteria group bacterium]MBU1563545.1 hypothetical protein [Patescibacteria group bacterium]